MTAARPVPFEKLSASDLLVGQVYEGGRVGTSADDPLHPLLRVGNMGGFRQRGNAASGWQLVALCSSGTDPDWPDQLDLETGLYTYYGDNRTPGRSITDTARGGNRLLETVFHCLHAAPSERTKVPPFFVFEKTGDGRDMRFLGLAVPGSSEIQATDDLVAIWRTTGQQRFQNYRAIFSVLNIPVVPRAWIEDLWAGKPMSAACPTAFRIWAEGGEYRTLRSPRTLDYRSREEQLPKSRSDLQLLEMLWERFSPNPTEFEGCAAELWRMHQGESVASISLTRPAVDGGRDAVGTVRVGPQADPIHLEFALEAKCYAPGRTGVGVKDMSRLISRLRHRQFGVLVTTSTVGAQAYREVREDRHPVVILAGADIVQTLRRHGINTPEALATWLSRDFRASFGEI